MSDPPITKAHLLVLLVVAVAALAWGAALILGEKGTPLEEYLLLLGLLGLASAVFIFSRIRENHIGVFYFPVFLTILVFVRFGVAPVVNFVEPKSLSPDFVGDYGFLITALAYVTAGMLAFWAGCSLALRKSETGAPEAARKPAGQGPAEGSILVWAAAIYAAVFAAKLYLLHSHLFSYVGSWQAYNANLSQLQVLSTVASLGGGAALTLVTIERYFHPADMAARKLFWAIFLMECAWGVASGMKADALQPLVIVAMVSSLIERKFKKGWVAVALLGLIAIYPFTNNYRHVVLKEGGLSSVAGVASAATKALTETQQDQRGASGWVQNGWTLSVKRVDMLTSFGLVLWLGKKVDALRGEERWWMVPYYPFIPRFMWHSKPVLDKGRRFSVAIGSTDTSSMAITYPGDLFANYGLPGVLAGMFLLGVVVQALTNTITGVPDKRRLFIYAAMFISVSHLETDSFSYLTSLIKNLVMLSIIAFVIYGPVRRAAKVKVVRRKTVEQPCES